MHKNLLKIIHKTIINRSIKYNYNEIPKFLPSLYKQNPTKIELNHDYSKLSTHFSHPVFIDFIPNYSDMSKNMTQSWLNLYINRNK
mgnify:CR=1 FL=1